MNKQPTTIRTYLLRGAFLLSLLCVIVIPLALGQRDMSKRSSDVELPLLTQQQLPSGFCAWSAGPDMPSPDVRSVGVFFPANGKFYAMGGRAFDGGGGEFINPFEFDGNSWTTKSAVTARGQTPNAATR